MMNKIRPNTPLNMKRQAHPFRDDVEVVTLSWLIAPQKGAELAAAALSILAGDPVTLANLRFVSPDPNRSDNDPYRDVYDLTKEPDMGLSLTFLLYVKGGMTDEVQNRINVAYEATAFCDTTL